MSSNRPIESLMKFWVTCTHPETEEEVYKCCDVTIEHGNCKAFQSIDRRLRARLRTGQLTPNMKLKISIRNQCGYFSSCPEVLVGYYEETTTIGQYFGISQEVVNG